MVDCWADPVVRLLLKSSMGEHLDSLFAPGRDYTETDYRVDA